MNRHITQVTFHWSESIYITKMIDPSYANRDDANYLVGRTDAQKMFKKAAKELVQRDLHSVKTSVTFHFDDKKTLTRIFELKANAPQLENYI